MKRALVSFALLMVVTAVLWRFYPEVLEPLVERTPLKRHLSSSRPVYQWRDARGNWQVTDEPPPEGTPHEIKQYALDANILPSSRDAGGRN